MIGTLYHWAPSNRRESIRTRGLLPGQPPTVASSRQNTISLSPSPSAAWELSAAMDWVAVQVWDLWEVKLDAVVAMLTVHTDAGSVVQVFCAEAIPVESLFWCGTRRSGGVESGVWAAPVGTNPEGFPDGWVKIGT